MAKPTTPAEARGIDPDLIRWDEAPWDRARKAQDFTAADS